MTVADLFCRRRRDLSTDLDVLVVNVTSWET
jgi:hypothetical protein